MPDAPEPGFSLSQRIKLWFITWTGFLAIRLIAPTLRYRVSREETAIPADYRGPGIFPFWHNCVFPAAWFFRNRDAAVMTSRSFDGEYIARIIHKLGYEAVRGSSSRGGAAALLEMAHQLEQGRPVAFTIDGPRGPRYVAKPGPIMLARNTGQPILPLYIALDRPWVLRSWDGFMIPRPFSRALVRGGTRIFVARDADAAEQQRKLAEMQAALDRVRDYAITNVANDSPGPDSQEAK